MDQRNALTLYLEALLNEVCVEDEDSEFDANSIDNDSNGSAQPVAHQAISTTHDTVTEPAYPNQSILRQPVSHNIFTEQKAPLSQSQQSESQPAVTPSLAPVINVASTAHDLENPADDSEIGKQREPPAWALPRCQVLTFTLGTMQMAAPLNQLNGIIPMPERLTILPGQSQWFLGLARNREQNVQVIDLASVIQPHRRCDNSTVLTLEPQQVQWQPSPHVAYILGTVINQMHSVLCVDTLLQRLENGQLV